MRKVVLLWATGGGGCSESLHRGRCLSTSSRSLEAELGSWASHLTTVYMPHAWAECIATAREHPRDRDSGCCGRVHGNWTISKGTWVVLAATVPLP